MMAEHGMYHQHVSWISEELWFYSSQGGDYLFSRMCCRVLWYGDGRDPVGRPRSFPKGTAAMVWSTPLPSSSEMNEWSPTSTSTQMKLNSLFSLTQPIYLIRKMSLQYLIKFTTCSFLSGHFEVINRVLFITVVDFLNVTLCNSFFFWTVKTVFLCK
jgi:hypothetical protein